MNRTVVSQLFAITVFSLWLAGCVQSDNNEAIVARAADDDAASETSKKRLAPPNAKPVVIDGIRYEAPKWGKTLGLGQNGGHLRAVDVASGDELWMLVIYEIVYDGDMEDDKFDRFITKISDAGNGRLHIESERCGTYTVDTGTRAVTVEHEPPC